VLVAVPATGGDGLVHGEHLAGHHRPVVAAYRGRGRLTDGPGGLAVHQRGGEGGGQRGGVPVREERAVAPPVEHGTEGGDVAGHDVGAAAHRLDEHDAEALPAG